MQQFKVGDRVKIIRNEGGVNTRGMEGVVKFISEIAVGVEHDRCFLFGHDLTFKGTPFCSASRGRWYRNPDNQLQVISSLHINPDVDLDSVI